MRKSHQQKTLERISSLLPSLSLHDLDALIIVANQWRREKMKRRSEGLNSISVVNNRTDECLCVRAEKPLCGEECFHFHSPVRGMTFICKNCNNTGKQIQEKEVATEEKSEEVMQDLSGIEH